MDGGLASSSPTAAVGEVGDGVGRRPRADAARNRARILQATREVLARDGLSAQIDEIARRAGVGTGTIYRNFPTRQALLEAVVADGVQQYTERARAFADAGDPTRALFDCLAEWIERSREQRAFSEMLMSAGIDVRAAKAGAAAELREALGVLLRRAQDVGGVRRDVGIAELMALVAATCTTAAQYDADAKLLSRVVCSGLRPD
jgi:AcrR family transcriptional regulator